MTQSAHANQRNTQFRTALTTPFHPFMLRLNVWNLISRLLLDKLVSSLSLTEMSLPEEFKRNVDKREYCVFQKEPFRAKRTVEGEEVLMEAKRERWTKGESEKITLWWPLTC